MAYSKHCVSMTAAHVCILHLDHRATPWIAITPIEPLLCCSVGAIKKQNLVCGSEVMENLALVFCFCFLCCKEY